jgi:hypothetical protein
VGVAIVAPILLVVGSPAIVSALTKEEASRCRAMRNYIERRDCFESLKEESKAKAEEAAKAKTGNAPSPPAPDAATTSAIDHLSVAPDQPVCRRHLRRSEKDAIGAMTRDARYDRTARLADLEDRVGALERVNAERGIPAATVEKPRLSGKSAASSATMVSSGRLSFRQNRAACGGTPMLVIVRR